MVQMRTSSVQSSVFRVLLGVSLKFMRFLTPHTKSRSVFVPSGWHALAAELPSHSFYQNSQPRTLEDQHFVIQIKVRDRATRNRKYSQVERAEIRNNRK